MADEQNASTDVSKKQIDYIGKEELKYFLSLINELGNAKYFPIDGTPSKALSAAAADKLTKNVFINNQPFNGTQNITFDEYAKTADVLLKKDRASAENDDNKDKVVALNSKSKIDNDYLDIEYIKKVIEDAPIKEVVDALDTYKKENTKTIDTIQAENENQGTDIAAIKNYVAMQQAKIDVPKDKLPASITIDNVDFEDFCTLPIEVLRDASKTETTSLDYAKMNYQCKQDADFTIKSDSIDVKPKLKANSLLIRDKYSEEVDLSNYKDHPEALQKVIPMPSDGKTDYLMTTCSIDVNSLSPSAKLTLAQPKGKFYCAALVGSQDVYRISDGNLVKGFTASAPFDFEHGINPEDVSSTVAETKKGTPDTMITMDMLRALKSSDVKLFFCFEQEEQFDAIDMTISDLPKDGYLFDTDTMLSTQFKEIKSIASNVTCTDSTIRFGIKRRDENEEYLVWDTETKTWKIVAEDEIRTKGALAEDIASIPADAWNMNNLDYSLIFVFLPATMEAVCTLGTISLSCESAFGYEKALYGTDYTYALGRRNIRMSFAKEGGYLINYPITDKLPKLERKTTTLTLQ